MINVNLRVMFTASQEKLKVFFLFKNLIQGFRFFFEKKGTKKGKFFEKGTKRHAFPLGCIFLRIGLKIAFSIRFLNRLSIAQNAQRKFSTRKT